MKINPPYCTHIQEELLEFDWDAIQRDKAARALKHLEECDVCRQAIAEYDLIRRTVAPHESAPMMDEAATERIRQVIDHSSSRPRGFGRYLWPLAAAACVLITAALNLAPRFAAQPSPAPVSVAAHGPSEADISQGIRAFHNVSTVFNNRTSWIALSDDASDVGIADGPMSPSARPVIVYMNLKQKETVVSQLTLAIVPGQAAHIEVPGTAGQKVRYSLNVAAGDPHKITVSIDLAPAAELKTTLRLGFGQQVQAASIMTTQGSYDLILGLYGDKDNATSDKAKL